MKTLPYLFTRVLTPLLLTAHLTHAQETGNKLSGGFGHFAGSYETVNLSEFNTTLSAAGYLEVPTSYMSFGGAGYFVIRNVLLGGGGASLDSYQVAGDSTLTEIGGGYGFVSVGYVFATGRRAIFYPNIGMGGGGFTAQLGKTGATQDFTQQLLSPHGRFQAGAGGYFVNVQLAWQTMVGTETRSGWSIGLKAGYRFGALGWQTHVNGNRGINSPRMNMNGFYASIIIGGGSLVGS